MHWDERIGRDVLILDLDRAFPSSFETLCECPDGHSGIHQLDRCQDDPSQVKRTCAQEGCYRSWRQAL